MRSCVSVFPLGETRVNDPPPHLTIWTPLSTTRVSCSGAGAVHQLGVLGEDTLGVPRRQRFPAHLAGFELGFVHQEVEAAGCDVHADPVAVLDEGDGSAIYGLGRDVADTQPRGATGEAAVGEE